MDKVKLITDKSYERLCDSVDTFTENHNVYSIDIVPTQDHIHGFLVYYTTKEE